MLYLLCIYICVSILFNIKKQNRKILILFDFGFFLYLIVPLIILNLKPEIFISIEVIKEFYFKNLDLFYSKGYFFFIL
ncbi:hypothetical protein HMPREF2747_15320 [Fusobacterium sp. HMSC073F01]|nr:hypothetical protein HMPREF2747_15320 [Fusobacterium sp. HMSC073F01]